MNELAQRSPVPSRFDPDQVRTAFPALDQEVHPGVPLIYLDSAATALKPRSVIDAVDAYLGEFPANVHRGLHVLSERATEAFEGARAQVAGFLGRTDESEIVFTRGSTEAINLVALSWGRSVVREGDEIVVSELEHHANLLPWQMLAQATGAVLRYAEIGDDGTLDLDSVERLLASGRVRLVAVSGMSNVLGTILPVAEILRRAHDHGALVLVDAAQSLPHAGPVSGPEREADFLAFSGHKLFGPTGIGVLCARRELLEAMPPVFGGGGMVTRVDRDTFTPTEPPWKFEAGTPPIAEAIGLGAAVAFLRGLDWEAIRDHERWLTRHAHRVIGALPGVRIHGPEPASKGSILAFTVEGVHPHDIAQIVDRRGLAIRAGHHCAMPLHRRLGLTATARASLALYNTIDEVDRLAEAILEAQHLFQRD